jgi:ATP-dependent Clp protease ATP-binding subunit ClpA
MEHGRKIAFERKSKNTWMNWFDSAKERLATWKAQEADSRALAQKMLTPRALQVFILVRKEAERLKHNYIGTEHLLLGLLTLNNGVAVNVLKDFGLNPETVSLEVEKWAALVQEKPCLVTLRLHRECAKLSKPQKRKPRRLAILMSERNTCCLDCYRNMKAWPFEFSRNLMSN